jgi:hypothetical protein
LENHKILKVRTMAGVLNKFIFARRVTSILIFMYASVSLYISIGHIIHPADGQCMISTIIYTICFGLLCIAVTNNFIILKVYNSIVIASILILLTVEAFAKLDIYTEGENKPYSFCGLTIDFWIDLTLFIVLSLHVYLTVKIDLFHEPLGRNNR